VRVAPVLREGGNNCRDDDYERSDAGDESHHSLQVVEILYERQHLLWRASRAEPVMRRHNEHRIHSEPA
jgi:hypothetical protein